MAGIIEPIGMMALLLRRGVPTLTYSSSKIMTMSRSSSSTASKSKQAVVIKRLRKENKDMFGDLLETKYEKVKREKKIAKNTKKNAKNVSSISTENALQIETTSTDTNEGDISKNSTTDTTLDNMTERQIGAQNEIDWTLKTFPERSKIIRRSDPSSPIKTFEKAVFPSGQYKVFKKEKTSSGMSLKEFQALPTMKQIYESFQESHDILPSFETKILRKDVMSRDKEPEGHSSSGQIPEELVIGNETNEMGDVSIDGVKIKGRMSNTNNAWTNEKIEISSHDEGDKSSNTTSPLLSSTDPPIHLFPYDNPEKKSENFRIETEESEIISFPFPMRISQTSSSETLSSPHPKIPSVSKILNATMSPEQAEILKKWQEKMIAKLGEMGFQRYKEDLFQNGKKFHANIQALLSGTPADELEIDEGISGHWNSLQSIFPKIERVHVLESAVFHPKLNYCGIVDCVAKFGDKLVVIDWKTSEKPKPHLSMTYDTPLQIAAYVGALNYDPNYSLKIHAGLVVIAYKDGKNCQTYFLNSSQIDNYWKQWLKRLKLYKSMDHNQL